MLTMVLTHNNAYSCPVIEVIWPPFWTLFLIRENSDFKRLSCVMFNNRFQSVIPLPQAQTCFVDSALHRLFITTVPTSPLFVSSLYALALNMAPVMRLFVLKLKFRGKGFYLYRNARNVLRFRFGFSHRINRYFPATHLKLMSKTSLMLFGKNREVIANAGVRIWQVRPINVYTGKGIRFNRQIVYRKPGKMSTYR
jgi:hypothetical protein